MCFPDDPNIIQYHCRTGVGFTTIQGLALSGSYVAGIAITYAIIGTLVEFLAPNWFASRIANDSHTAFNLFDFVISDVWVL